MIQRIYIDTSVLGGLFDIEFSDATKSFFDRVEKGELRIVYSEVTNEELAYAPEQVRSYLNALRSHQKEFVEITQEAITLADTYYPGKSCRKNQQSRLHSYCSCNTS